MRWFYRCPACGSSYEIEPGRYLCDSCSKRQQKERPLEGVLEAEWEGDDEAYRFSGSGTIPLPVEAKWFPPIPVGNTPLWEPARLRKELGFPGLFLKDDTGNPTGSFKDRASYLAAAFAAKHGIGEIALASTGNAASSMAGVGAAAGITVTVFLPASAPAAKRIQVLQYGADLRTVEGTYD
ncbi:MAG TPA: pyridoxal-phosphate dependent enzyme, partial [Spirochaetia bacterium]|nr:pyridoxal-phosphate dependent enzyme [Spirochaetia bacterium]